MDERIHEPLINVYHMEKYIIPGAAAVLFVVILPQAILQGVGQLQHVELVPALLACFVLGHLMESVRIYRFAPQVEKNWRSFYLRDLGNHIIEHVGTRRNKQHHIDTLASLWDESGDNLLTGAERSELAWNLVRWQKMISLSIIFWICAIEWAALAAIQWLKSSGETSPILVPSRIVYLAPWVSDFGATLANTCLFVISVVVAVWLARAGLSRQRKSNRKRLAYITAHAAEIEAAILRDPEQQLLQPQPKS